MSYTGKEPNFIRTYRTFTATANQTVFDLVDTPQQNSVMLFVAGSFKVPVTDFTVAGTTLTTTSSVSGGAIVCVYFDIEG